MWAVRVEGWPVHHGIAGSAMSAGVSAAVAEAGDMTHEDLLRSSEWPLGQRLGGRVESHDLAVEH